ncbi:hypothetical protein KCV06_g33, partial [Aureobasidium melanogenum]
MQVQTMAGCGSDEPHRLIVAPSRPGLRHPGLLQASISNCGLQAQCHPTSVTACRPSLMRLLERQPQDGVSHSAKTGNLMPTLQSNGNPLDTAQWCTVSHLVKTRSMLSLDGSVIVIPSVLHPIIVSCEVCLHRTLIHFGRLIVELSVIDWALPDRRTTIFSIPDDLVLLIKSGAFIHSYLILTILGTKRRIKVGFAICILVQLQSGIQRQMIQSCEHQEDDHQDQRTQCSHGRSSSDSEQSNETEFSNIEAHEDLLESTGIDASFSIDVGVRDVE